MEEATKAVKATKAKGSRLLTYLAAGFVLPVIVVVLGNVLFSLAAMLNGDQKLRTAAASDANTSMHWYWAWQHQLMTHLVILWSVSVGFAALLALLLGPYPETTTE